MLYAYDIDNEHEPPSKWIDEGEEEAKMMDLQIIVFRVPWKLHGGSGDVAEIVVGNELTTTTYYNYYYLILTNNH